MRASPKTMRQVWITRHDPPEVLELREAAVPQPSEGEVLIEVGAAGVNFADIMARLGLYPDAPKPPRVVGCEVAAVGPSTAGFAVGDRVTALTRFGGYSSHVSVFRRNCGNPLVGMERGRLISLFATAAAPSIA